MFKIALVTVLLLGFLHGSTSRLAFFDKSAEPIRNLSQSLLWEQRLCRTKTSYFLCRRSRSMRKTTKYFAENPSINRRE